MEENTTIEERQEKDKLNLIETLKEMPIVQVACKKSGTSRATYYRWRKEDKTFKKQSDDALNQGIDFINDMSESQLITLIREKKMPAISMWLRHNNPRYGGKTQSTFYKSPSLELSPEKERIITQALKLSSKI